ncbi:MAG TPA: hypothetical protein VFQ67_17650 [Allosphingosinicella sp.]|nr:hypothetical protein [Allosphingosinicella sp.]
MPALLQLGAAPLSAAPVQAATPVLAWQQAGALRVLCLVGPKTRPDADRLQEEMCDSVRALAADGAPMAVSRVGFGDPAVLEPGTATLLVQASVQSDGDQRLVALNVRPFRPGGDHNAILFGAAPRAVRIPGSGPGGDKLEAALAAALAETLPWRQGR